MWEKKFFIIKDYNIFILKIDWSYLLYMWNVCRVYIRMLKMVDGLGRY